MSTPVIFLSNLHIFIYVVVYTQTIFHELRAVLLISFKKEVRINNSLAGAFQSFVKGMR